MLQERVERLAGVGAFIVKEGNPNLFLAITEGHFNRLTNKIAGMISAPFETIEEEDDRDHKRALERIFKKVGYKGEEELCILQGDIKLPEELEKAKLCIVQLTKGVWLHAYLLHASADLAVGRGKEADVMDEPQLVSVDEVLNFERGDNRFRFRPGMVEIVRNYLSYLADPENHIPQIYFEPVNSIPTSVFDLVGLGASQTEVLSQLYLEHLRLTGSPALVHSQ